MRTRRRCRLIVKARVSSPRQECGSQTIQKQDRARTNVKRWFLVCAVHLCDERTNTPLAFVCYLPWELLLCLALRVRATAVFFSPDWIGDLPDMCIEISCRRRVGWQQQYFMWDLDFHESMTIRSFSYYQKLHVQVVIAIRIDVSHVAPIRTQQNREYVDLVRRQYVVPVVLIFIPGNDSFFVQRNFEFSTSTMCNHFERGVLYVVCCPIPNGTKYRQLHPGVSLATTTLIPLRT